ncbi:hypothetical protein J1N35_025825, partial [Gossypium stocksii]
MATETLDNKKPEEEDLKDKENEEGSKEVLEEQIKVKERENEEEEKREEEEEEEESEGEEIKKVKGSSRKGSSRKYGRYSAEKKEPMAPNSDRPTRERKVVERFNETFDGVLLAYDLNILDKHAKILSGVHPYFGLRLKANLLLFSPKPDMLL